MVEPSDENLVKRVQNGDEEAFRLLVERHQRKLFGLCYGMVRNKDDAMDLVQETFLKIHRTIGGFRGNSAFYTWAYRIAKNVCIDFLRKHSKAKTVDYNDAIGREADTEEEAVLLPSRLDINPVKAVGRRELLVKIEEALGELSDIHRETLILREIQGLSYKEMAEVMDISIGTVMSRLHHARKKMQAHLEDYVDGELDVETK